MDNDIDTNQYYIFYTVDGIRTFAPTKCRIPAHMARQYLKDESNVSEIQEYIKRSRHKYELIDPESIRLYSIRVVKNINL